ncbi:hypothetical protein CERSUDRAFT_126194 [Gelatoporia subvermispora B]|uniref:F-box domain-containing protein n=1 Tax=Ceriporiopsis subvermispora (strain B) TaxID=914234 RepID=M2PCQ7_CERS8|nr:hypothetical protein CERSUDRAFT_126194 [Gelatoporia subvermispora B]
MMKQSGASASGSRPPGRIRYVRGKRGSLQEVNNMPLEIVFEIFSQLDPGDLVSLIRTNKDIRQLLLRRSSAFIWQAAHNNSGLPDRPPWMSEPALANLLYSNHCHICLKKNIRSITWPLWIRCCQYCKENLPEYSESIPRGLIPSNILYHELVPRVCLPSGYWVVYPPHVREFLQAWKSAGNDQIQERRVLENQVASCRNMYKCSRDFSCWHYWENRRRAEELAKMRHPRYDAVAAKLRELGYAKELSYAACSERIRKHPLVRASTNLTERAWTKMSDQLIRIMEEQRSRILHSERTSRILSLYELLVAEMEERGAHDEVSGIYYPRPVDLALMPEFRDCIDPPDICSPAHSVESQLQNLPIFTERWLDRVKSDLACAVISIIDVSASADVCALAISWFECGLCSRRFQYEDAITTPCIQGCVERSRCSICFCDVRKGWYERIIEGRYDTGGSPWCVHRLFKQPLIRYAAGVIRVFGEDPVSITAKEMDNIGGRLRTWREAIIKPSCEQPEWLLVDLRGHHSV